MKQQAVMPMLVLAVLYLFLVAAIAVSVKGCGAARAFRLANDRPILGTDIHQLPPPPREGEALLPNRPLLAYQATPMPAATARLTDYCKAGIVLDWEARTILWKKNEVSPLPIASMSKMFTVLEAFRIMGETPELSLQTKVKVSREAYSVNGSQVDLDPRETFTVGELLQFMMIHSANDAAQQIACTMGKGQSADFVSRMNETARKAGWTSFKFYNPHGLPEGSRRLENCGSALEVAELTGELLSYPDIVKWASTKKALIPRSAVRKTERILINRNSLLGTCPGVIGMKTGTTTKAGCCISAVCRRQERTVIVVIMGCPTDERRDELATALIEWGYKGK